jgi:hypothetical protein
MPSGGSPKEFVALVTGVALPLWYQFKRERRKQEAARAEAILTGQHSPPAVPKRTPFSTQLAFAIGFLAVVAVALVWLSGCWVQTRRDQYLRDHPGNPYAEQIHNGYLAVGETEEDVVAAWGTELRCSVVQSTHGSQWKYCGLGDGPSTFIDFDESGHVSDVTTVTN